MNNFFSIIKNLKKDQIVFEDKYVISFNDIKPVAPIHLLIVTKKFIRTINDITYNDRVLIGHCFFIASKISKILNISNDGYRLISNCNKNGGQQIFHFHIHMIAGKYLNKLI